MKEGLANDQPYGWGNKSAYDLWNPNASTKFDSHVGQYPIIFRYMRGVNPFYIPSGCAVKNWVDFNNGEHACDYLLNKK